MAAAGELMDSGHRDLVNGSLRCGAIAPPAAASAAHHAPVRRDLPSGTVTFLFTDMEGSTKHLHALGADAYAVALAEQRRVLREAFQAQGGVEVDTQGDAFFVAFPTAPGALAAASLAQEGLALGPIRVRMGVHTGTPTVTEEGYVGVDVHRAARIAACGHGGQVLVSSSTAALVGTEGLRDLGEHRLKDLSAPERIHQLGPTDFPPLRSLHQTNLPIPVTPFLGRAAEVAEVTTLMAREDVRLLTLTGPGGTGKTRLALQAAAELADRYRDGVWWVSLGALRDPRLVLPSVAQVLGTKAGPAEHIAGRSMLLFFDNFEQVVAAGADIAGLLAACPALDVLVTSREPLHVSGEHEYAVPPLSPGESVDLFLARARAVNADVHADDSITSICRRLDHLPLAIELAAARMKALSSAQILERLEHRLPLLTGGARDLPERQRTLRAAIAWSDELLAPEERRLFARLAVFRGGCTLEDAEAVAEAGLDDLQSLVDKSLVRHAEGRFAMLETIREYAAEQLAASGEAERMRVRHADRFLALAEGAEVELREGPKELLDRLEREHDNLRAALDQLASSGEGERELRLAGAVGRFWYLRGHLLEGEHRLESALRANERPTPGRAKVLNAAAVMAINTGDLATARLRAEAARTLHRLLGDAWGAAYAEFMLANVANETGDHETARQLLTDSVATFRALGDDNYALVAGSNLASVHRGLGDLDRARALYRETLVRARALGNVRIEALVLGDLAAILIEDGKVADGLTMVRESLRIRLHLADLLWIAVDLRRVAYALAITGQGERAAPLLARAFALGTQMGVGRTWIAEQNERALAAVRAQLDDAAFAAGWERGQSLTVDEAVALALERGDGEP